MHPEAVAGGMGPARRLRPTLEHTRRRHYRRPGGPWGLGTLDAVLSDPAAARRHRVVDGARRPGGGALAAAVDDAAGRLRHAGVRRGDAVAWQLPNGLAATLLFRACWRLGAVAVPLHHAAGAPDVAACLAQVGPRLVLGAPGSAAADLPGAVTLGSGGTRSSVRASAQAPVPAPALAAASTRAADPLDPLPAAVPVASGASPARPADLALVIFTSGSTGRPKAVLHTQRGLAWKTVSMARAHGLVSSDVVLAAAPMSHVSGLLSGVLLPAAAGMASVPVGRWDPERALDLVEGERVTFMAGPPTFFVTLIGTAGYRPERVATMRLVSTGGAAVSPELVASASEALGCRVKRTYGSSEAPMVTTSVPGDHPRRARDTDGRAMGEVELRVVGPGDRDVATGEPGELLVRGPELFAGYADPADNEGVLAPGGWYRTGDLATLDGDGWLRVVGRSRDVIIRGGENVAAAEVERVLEAHPSVRGAVVVPYPDPVMGERVAAAVVAPDGFDGEACREWCTGQGLARFKVPERLVHLPALPTLPSGKADRTAVRTLVAGEAGR